jgi:hypothetical protein
VFTARYALSPYMKEIRFVFKGLNMLVYCCRRPANMISRECGCSAVHITTVNSTILGDVTQCGLTDDYQHSGGICIQNFDMDVANHLPICMVSHPIKPCL